MLSTRRDSAVWLIGSPESDIEWSKLPSNGQVIRFFFYCHKQCGQTLRESARLTVRKVVPFWERARIPVQDESRAIVKVEKLFFEWRTLLKQASRGGKSFEGKKASFESSLFNLFDIAHDNAMEIIKIQEDKDFLAAQREPGRRGYMGKVDTALYEKEKRSELRRKLHQERNEKCTEERRKFSSKLQQDEQINEEHDFDNDDDYEGTSTGSKRKRPRRSTPLPGVCAALDRAKSSTRDSVRIISATIQSLGHNTDDYAVGRTSIWKHRREFRERRAADLKSEIRAGCPLVVHWDGKLLEDLCGRQIVDRLPIIVSGQGVEQLLGAPKLTFGTGLGMADTIYDALKDWNVFTKVVGMSFDTTSSNTGLKTGACTLLEKKLEKDLLYLACRHHISEICLKAAFEYCLGSTSGLEVLLFKRFQATWGNIDKSKYSDVSSCDEVKEIFCSQKEGIVSRIRTYLSETQPRGDYQELLQLALIFLGEVGSKDVKFKPPGAMHHARWLAKAIYSLKVWLLRDVFKLTAREEKGLRLVCIFVVMHYIDHWFTATDPIRAPSNDLLFLKNMLNFTKISIGLSNAVCAKICGHLWYFNEHNIGLSFFDNLPVELLRKMVECLNAREGSENVQPRLSIQNPRLLESANLSDFVTKKTNYFFELLQLPTNFLQKDPSEWELCESFQISKKNVRALRVVNDVGERGVALVQDYNQCLTNDEDQFQCLLQVVQDHRKRFPATKTNKTDLKL